MLKPCPFCGSGKVLIQYSFDNFDNERKVIHCLHCDVEVKACPPVADDELIRMWNRRADDAPD